MRRILCKRTVVTAVVMAFAMSVAFTGCKRKDVDLGSDDISESNVNESDSGKLKDRLKVPDSYSYSFDIGSSGVSSIEIDADEIHVPDTDKMFIAYMERGVYDNEFKKQVCESIFDKSKGIYVYDWEKRIKSDIQAEIDQYKEFIANANASGDTESVEWYQSYIKELEASLQDAPEQYDSAGDYSGDIFVGFIGEIKYRLNFSTQQMDGGGYSNIYLSLYDSGISHRPYEGASDVSYFEVYDSYMQDEDAEKLNQCAMTQEDAQRMAENMLNSIGIEDFALKDCRDVVWEYYDSSYNVMATVYDGYALTFQRAIDDVTTYVGNVWSVDNLSVDDGWLDLPVETYEVLLDDKGTLSLNVTMMFHSTGEKEKNVTLLTWDEMIAKANEQIGKYYEKYPTRYKKVEFNDVVLTYFVWSDKEKCSYIPVWVFSQYEEYQDTDASVSPQQMVVVNAMDGSIIDLIELAKNLGCYQTYEDIDDGMLREETGESVISLEDNVEEESSEGETMEDETAEGEASEDETSESETTENAISSESDAVE